MYAVAKSRIVPFSKKISIKYTPYTAHARRLWLLRLCEMVGLGVKEAKQFPPVGCSRALGNAVRKPIAPESTGTKGKGAGSAMRLHSERFVVEILDAFSLYDCLPCCSMIVLLLVHVLVRPRGFVFMIFLAEVRCTLSSPPSFHKTI